MREGRPGKSQRKIVPGIGRAVQRTGGRSKSGLLEKPETKPLWPVAGV